MNFEKWMSTRTFHNSQFEDVSRLAALKEAQGLSISLCLPTLNEERTVGKIIGVLKRELMEKVPLLDEIGIVDSGSTDRTREIAQRRGAKVFLASECLPELGAIKGKGENLWKSLYLFSGDIIVWIDADIRNIHPKFVYGLLGPILENPEISYVKAFYRRPLRIGGKVTLDGGRVTELLVRPYLSMLFPDLSALAQPLSGEYAGRRTVLERVPFQSGYGVEVGLLIDIERQFGIQSIAQVDMDVRVHRNQDLASLRKMSHTILSALMTRSEQLGKFAMLEGLGRELHLVRKNDASYVHDTEADTGTERPPMIAVPAYRRLRGIPEEDAALFEDSRIAGRSPRSIANLFREPLVVLELAADSVEGAIAELTGRLEETGYVSGDTDELVELLMRRERRMSTAVGHGVAVPHLITDAVTEPLIVVGRSRRGIAFTASPFPRPVRLIFMILAPATKRSEYLAILSSFMRMLRHGKPYRHLLSAGTAQEIVNLLAKYETLMRLHDELRQKRSR
jgi:glucosyl-3-phosphoglycerate synthase